MNHHAWKRDAAILWGGRFLSTAGLTGISPFIPYYLETMHVGSAEDILFWTGLSLSAPAFSYALLTPLWGKLGDRYSRKWMVVRALLGLAISMLLMALAQTPLQFFLFRLCQGAFGGIADASSAFIGSHAPPKQQGQALGRLERASIFGLLGGPLLGGLCVQTLGSGPLLLIAALLMLALAIAAAFVLSPSDPQRTAADSRSRHRQGILGAFAELLVHPIVRRFLLAGILFKLIDFSTFSIFTPFIRERLHSPEQAALVIGILLAVSSVGELIGSSWWGKRNDQGLPERNIKLASVLCAVCLFAQAIPLGMIWLAAVRFFEGFFFSALLQSVMLVVLRNSADTNRGVRVGATNSLLMIGQVSGPTIGVLIGAQLGMSAVFVVMSAVMLLAAALFTRLPAQTSLHKPLQQKQ